MKIFTLKYKILNKETKIGLNGKITFELRLESAKLVFSGRINSRRNSQCKGPRAGACLVC